MQTEYGGAPVDGGTIPALICNEVVSAYGLLRTEEEHGKQPKALAPSDAHHPGSGHPLAPATEAPIAARPRRRARRPVRHRVEPRPRPNRSHRPTAVRRIWRGPRPAAAPSTGGVSG